MVQTTKSQIFRIRSFIALALATSSVVAMAADPAADFSDVLNPSNGWRYGYSTALGGTFNLDTGTGNNGPVAVWYTPTNLSGSPFIAKNQSGSVYTYATSVYLPGQLVMGPGSQGEFSVLRYTLPTTSTYQINASWIGRDTGGTTTDVHLFHNSISLFSGYVNGYGSTQNTTNTIFGTVGDQIDIYVGSGGNGSGKDNTGLEMTIVPAVPEPASMLALGIGAVGLLRKKLSRKS